MALHGTNSALDLPRPNGVESPRCFPTWVDTLGSQFIAHPPIMPYTVEVTDPIHWLVAGVGSSRPTTSCTAPSTTTRRRSHPLLHTHVDGRRPRVRRSRLDRAAIRSTW